MNTFQCIQNYLIHFNLFARSIFLQLPSLFPYLFLKNPKICVEGLLKVSSRLQLTGTNKGFQNRAPVFQKQKLKTTKSRKWEKTFVSDTSEMGLVSKIYN